MPTVTSKNLRGHRGIIEHTLSCPTEGCEYDGLLVEGVAVNVLDNDFSDTDRFGWVAVVDDTAVHVMNEDGYVKLCRGR